MSTYTARIYHNSNPATGDDGHVGEYEMHTSWDDTHDRRDVSSEEAVRLRLLETQALNSAAIAASLDRIAATLDNMFNNRGWGGC